ncbi:Mu-like prophage major head subunit gpT family protein [Edwardsiella hoshinae]|uniref:Mu-like prophage major head subunit gpT n=1 Tax=Edwardsiella hoshinae TaxID=93378 RepID=A0A376DH50_9GAMM|nr:Mu-like prophage major head subunit gpT family protein [Edwardsiella hoshinae]QPR26777.1 Mu-like prophage major head subunit gpT family protein [Edwardsiella hoshinae]STC89442.1 Mu-like prophage major head subunit gpT [Edwardsiella hoshinae]
MIIDKKNITTFFVGLKKLFNDALKREPGQWEKVAMKVPSGTKTEDYSWLSDFPRMRKWIGEKCVKALAAFKYSITNDDWETTIEVDRNDLEDDQTGQYALKAKSAGRAAADLPDDIVFALINNGFKSTCFDGQYFFDTDHPQAGGTVSNKGTKALSCSSLAEAKASFGAAKMQMRRFTDSEGRPLSIRPTVLLVPPELEDTANTLMTADRFEDGKTNIYKGACEVVVEPRLTSPTAWFLLDTSNDVKPFIYQERKAPKLVEQTDGNADDVFMRRKYKFGAEARAAGGYGFWQMAYGSTGEA